MQLEHQENFVVEAMGAEMLSLQTIFKPYSPRNSKETKMWVFLFCFFLRGVKTRATNYSFFFKIFFVLSVPNTNNPTVLEISYSEWGREKILLTSMSRRYT